MNLWNVFTGRMCSTINTFVTLQAADLIFMEHQESRFNKTVTDFSCLGVTSSMDGGFEAVVKSTT